MPDTPATVRTLHGIAEALLSGPQYRTSGTIRLRVVPGGIATVAAPALRLDATAPDGAVLVVDEARRVSVTGTFADVGAATGHGFGEPEGLYHDHSGVTAAEATGLDAGEARERLDWLLLADAALRAFAPRQHPTLWPEHFDVSVEVDGVPFGASPGDAFSPEPYAYVSETTLPRDAFWDAPFGAMRTRSACPDLASLVTFWSEALDRLRATSA